MTSKAFDPREANPYVFIVGCPRSGTTLLKRMLNAHSRMAIMRESPWIIQCFEAPKGLTSRGLVTPELICHLLQNPKFNRLGIGADQLEALLAVGQPTTYASFVASIFDLYGKSRGKALIGQDTLVCARDKYPACPVAYGALRPSDPRRAGRMLVHGELAHYASQSPSIVFHVERRLGLNRGPLVGVLGSNRAAEWKLTRT